LTSDADLDRSRHSETSGKKLNAYYVAPEVFQNVVTEKSDIWSIGVILFLLLTGVPPFNGETDKEIIAKVKSGKYNTQTLQASGVSADGIEFISSLLTYDYKKRPTATEAL